jgi:hypothetical protein
MGIIVDVYRSFRENDDFLEVTDCTNGGVTNCETGVHKLTLVNVDGPFDPTPTRPAAWLVPGNVGGSAKIVPHDEYTNKTWTMFGGNYAGTSDSRFTEAVEKITGATFYGAVPIHDRVEH